MRPIVLRGARAIGRELGMTAAQAGAMHRAGLLPTWRVGGTPYTIVGGLAEWRTLRAAGELPGP